MTYYMVRHKATGEFMPELKRTRGYSHWNPAKVDTAGHLGKKLLGIPRLFPRRNSAFRAIVAWNAMPNGRVHGFQSYESGEWDENISSKDDGRSKDDLEVVEVNIEVKNEHYQESKDIS